jgi:hypothetical protein
MSHRGAISIMRFPARAVIRTVSRTPWRGAIREPPCAVRGTGGRR